MYAEVVQSESSPASEIPDKWVEMTKLVGGFPSSFSFRVLPWLITEADPGICKGAVPSIPFSLPFLSPFSPSS